MTVNLVRTGRTTRPEWGLAERVESDTDGHVLGVLGVPAVAAVVTFLMFRATTSRQRRHDQRTLDPKFRK